MSTMRASDTGVRSPRFRIPAEIFAWAGLAFTWLLFELPSALQPGDLTFRALRPTLDVLILLTLWGVSYFLPRGQTGVRRGLKVMAVVLFVYRLDEMIFRLLMRDEPLLYDQWFMIRHLFVLISDLMSFKTAAVVLGFVAAVVLVTLFVRRSLVRARMLLEPQRLRTTQRVAMLVWTVLMISAAVSPVGEPAVRFLSPQLVHNVSASIATYASIQRGVEQSPYGGFSNIKLKQKPDVLLFIVESYGRILSVHEGTRDHHGKLLDKLEHKLGAGGWHMASAFSRSSVSGGRSWLAEGTMLMGTPIKYEAVFAHLISQGNRVPNFVSFLRQNDYDTMLLVPADRNRPGARVANRYGFNTILSNETLGYRGPPMGWGLVPDQFALQVARVKLLDQANRKRPVFMDFHMVTSHAPWSAVPPIVGDASLLNRLTSKFGTSEPEKDAKTMVLRRLRRYERDEDGATTYMNEFTEPLRRGYQATVTYDLNVIEQYLDQRKDDALVIIIGDHQPPVITKANASFDTPVHVLSRDPRRLAELKRQGFVSGMTIPDDSKAAITHAGLFSLFVRTLAAELSSGSSLPRVLPEGQVILGQL
jgi:hypothetical protein